MDGGAVEGGAKGAPPGKGKPAGTTAEPSFHEPITTDILLLISLSPYHIAPITEPPITNPRSPSHFNRLFCVQPPFPQPIGIFTLSNLSHLLQIRIMLLTLSVPTLICQCLFAYSYLPTLIYLLLFTYVYSPSHIFLRLFAYAHLPCPQPLPQQCYYLPKKKSPAHQKCRPCDG